MEPGRRILLLGPLLVALLAGASTPARSEGRVLELSRLPCYEGCPSYRVVLHEDGKVEIQGRQNVSWVGTHKEKGAAGALSPVFAQADAIGFSGLRAAYGIGCRKEGAAGLATLTLATGGTSKKVRFQTGCTDASATLRSLEGLASRVDQTALTPERLEAMGAPAGTTGPPTVIAEASDPPAESEAEDVEAPAAEAVAEEPLEASPPEEAAAPVELAELEDAAEAEPTAPAETPEEPAPAVTEPEPAGGPADESEELLADSSEGEPPPQAMEEPAGSPPEAAAEDPTELAAGDTLVSPSTLEQEETAERAPAPSPEAAAPAGSQRPREEDPEVPARELLGRFEEAYNACNVDAMRDVLELDADTESFFSEQCARCGGFDVDVELTDWVEAPNRLDLYFEQRVRCRRSRTLSIFDLVAEVPRGAAPWRIDRIGRAP